VIDTKHFMLGVAGVVVVQPYGLWRGKSGKRADKQQRGSDENRNFSDHGGKHKPKEVSRKGDERQTGNVGASHPAGGEWHQLRKHLARNAGKFNERGPRGGER